MAMTREEILDWMVNLPEDEYKKWLKFNNIANQVALRKKK